MDFQYYEEGKLFKLPLWKRVFDIVFTLLAIIVLFVPMLIVYIIVFITCKANPIYKSKRVGANYEVFDFLKFRSMYIDADKKIKDLKERNQYSVKETNTESKDIVIGDDGDMSSWGILGDDCDLSDIILVSDEDDNILEKDYLNNKNEDQENAFIKIKNDPRITPIGRFIRKYSIDELPQLINILKGDMSIVGNRPLPLYEAEMLTGDDYIDRFLGPAGLTGLWQVEKRGDSGALSPEERKKLDIYYAKNFSFWMDIKIIFKTFTAFIQKADV